MCGQLRDALSSLFARVCGLRHELTRYLRTRRAVRPALIARVPDGDGARLYELSIADHPAESADQAVPGHEEGNLTFGTISPASRCCGRCALRVLRVLRGKGDP